MRFGWQRVPQVWFEILIVGCLHVLKEAVGKLLHSALSPHFSQVYLAVLTTCTLPRYSPSCLVECLTQRPTTPSFLSVLTQPQLLPHRPPCRHGVPRQRPSPINLSARSSLLSARIVRGSATILIGFDRMKEHTGIKEAILETRQKTVSMRSSKGVFKYLQWKGLCIENGRKTSIHR